MGLLKTCLRPAVHLVREAGVRSEMLAQTGQGPLVAFLPAYGRHGAALLRIYNIADALRPLGWRTLVIPATLTLAQRHRILAGAGPDIVVMQGARHGLNRPAFYPDYPIVYDMDDADFHLPHLAGPVERAMADVACVLAGSSYIADWCRTRGADTKIVWTGGPISRKTAPPQCARAPVVAWAQTRPARHTGEADWVFQVMRRVSARFPEVRLRFYGRGAEDGPEFLHRFEDAGIRVEWLKKARYRDYLETFDDVSLGLAPLSVDTPFSRGKAFGKVLAYLDRRVPVIASDVGEYGAFFDRETGVVSNAPDVWVERIIALLENAAFRQRMADAAFRQFDARLSVSHAATETDRILRQFLP